MIKLINSYNHKGIVIDADTVISLDAATEAALVKNRNAEYTTQEAETPDKEEKALQEYTKPELLALAKKLGIEDIKDSMSKPDIIKRIEENVQS